MRVTVLIDAGVADNRDPQFLNAWAESREPPMERSVVAALREAGNDVIIIPLRGDVLAEIYGSTPDVIFNLTEHVDGNRRRASEIPAMLDLLGFAYTGATAAGHVLSNDKAISKQIVDGTGMHVPLFEVLPVGTTRLTRSIPFPVIVKPRFGDGSEGITLRSLVYDEQALAQSVRQIHYTMHQAAICEEFIDGRELAVGMIGDGALRAFPVRETAYGTWRGDRPRFNTTMLKSSEKFRTRFGIRSVRADLPEAVARKIHQHCKAAFRALELRDYARFDLRLGPDGRCFFIEANCNCDLKPAAFGVMAEWAGITYPVLIDMIVRLAARRTSTALPVRDSRPILP